MSQTRPILVAVLPLLISAAIMIAGNGLFGTLLSVRMDLEAFPVDRIGLILAFYSVGFVAGTRASPIVVDRVGHIRAFTAFAAIAAVTALLHALVVDAVLWAALRMLTGFAAACLYTIIESWLNAKAPNAVRGTVMSAYMSVNFVAFGGAQLLLPTMDPAGFQLFSLVAILIACSLVPLALARVAAPPDIVSARLSLRQLIAISPLGVAGCFAAGLVNGAFSALGPLYARSLEDSTAWIAEFMAIAVISGFVLQFPMGRLSDRFDRRTVILGLTLALTVTALLMGLIGGLGSAVLIPLLALYGGISYTLYPISLTHANDYVTPDRLIAASAGLLLCFGVGSILGPIAAAQAMGVVGEAGLFFFFAAVGAILSAFVVLRMRRRAPLPNAEQGPFVAVPQTTAEAVTLDPRSDPEEGRPGDARADEPEDDRQLAFDFDPPPPGR
jgi:MFS family permease